MELEIELNIHDNWVYSHYVDYFKKRIILFTVYPHSDPEEFTDIYFDDVAFHYFEQEVMKKHEEYPPSVLFDISIIPHSTITEIYAELFERLKNNGWPPNKKTDDLNVYFNKYIEMGYQCYDIGGVCGLSGFVVAKTVYEKSRKEKFVIEKL